MTCLLAVFIATLLLCALAALLAVLLLAAEAVFANYGECRIDVNGGDKALTVQGGQSLLASLADQKVFLPSACGGRGSCGVCKCRVKSGAGPVLPTERPYLTDEELDQGVRLSCQVKVKEDISIEVPEGLLAVRELSTTVESVTDLTHDIKGLRFRLPEGERMPFKAGQYVQLVAPPYGEVHEETFRAYSIASPPHETAWIDLIIRLVPDGIVTTFVFEHLSEGDAIRLVGPFGDFHLRESDREILFIAGGSGLAPIRSVVLDMIERKITHRSATFYFGAVQERDLYYVDAFQELAREHDWFRFVPALSGDEGGHDYERGLITEVVERHADRLEDHEAYLCGSPGMIDACIEVLLRKGVPEERIFYDKFA